MSDVSAPPIRFGTSGWRGILADEVTLPRARALAWAVGAWAQERASGARILVGHDTRALGPELTAAAARVLAGCGARPLPVRSPIPTPVVTHAVGRGRALAGLLFTASHNGPEYHGAKVVTASGGGADPQQTRRIEALARRALAAAQLAEGPVAARPVDLVPFYLKALSRNVDGSVFRSAGLRVVYDALHGTGAGVCDRALRELGARVELLRGARDPRFAGQAPDPTPARLQELARRVRAATRPCIGLATDGDADRYAVIDTDGRPLSETQALALLVDHLARTGRIRRGLAVSIATGSLVERVAAHHGLRVQRHPIGFRYFTGAFLRGEADVAGEESGGFGLARLGGDKDGILACCLLAEIVAATRAPLRSRLRQLERRHGRSACGRIALRADEAARERLGQLVSDPPRRIGGAAVRGADTRDGLRLDLDDGFLMLRASGTEPVLRIYAEASDARRLARRFGDGRRLLGA